MKALFLYMVLFGCLALSGCGILGVEPTPDYTIGVTVKSQEIQFQYADSLGNPVCSWVDSYEKFYRFDCNDNSKIHVDFPATITVIWIKDESNHDVMNHTLEITFNEDGNKCNIKNLKVNVYTSGSTRWSEYEYNDCGRTKIGAWAVINYSL